MENVAHSLVGYALARAGLEKHAPLASAALLIGANLPDAEVIGSLFGSNYLDSHRGVTHGAAGILALSVALAGGLWILGRCRKSGIGWRSRLIPLWYLSLLGLLSHILLDYCNDYGVRPWLPFSDHKYYGDLLSIIDPWIWVIFGSALFLMTASRRGRRRWIVFGSILAVLAVLISPPIQGLLCLLVIPAALWIGNLLRARGGNPARAAFVAFLLYLGGLAGARALVLRTANVAAAAAVPERIRKIEVLPGRPASPLRWFVVMEASETYYAAEVILFDRTSRPKFEAIDKNLNNPYYQESLAQGSMAAMARFARFPYVFVESSPNGSHTILLRDLRYARERTEGWGTARAIVPRDY